MDKQEQIEEIAKYICNACEMGFDIDGDCAQGNNYKTCGISKETAEYIYNAGYLKVPDGAVILTKEEYEKIKSLYDCQHGSIMTSSIGDLPLTIGDLRKAVDEISRLINVQTELQVLNAKYYNEAKHLRRELKQARKETAEKIYERLIELSENPCNDREEIYKDVFGKYGVEVEE